MFKIFGRRNRCLKYSEDNYLISNKVDTFEIQRPKENTVHFDFTNCFIGNWLYFLQRLDASLSLLGKRNLSGARSR